MGLAGNRNKGGRLIGLGISGCSERRGDGQASEKESVKENTLSHGAYFSGT
jgi:hypothetical protein